MREVQAMKDADPRVVNKIKKLLRVAEDSPFPAEVEAAVLRAQEILAKHGISREDLEDGSDAGASALGEIVTEMVSLGSRKIRWLSQLGSVIADNFRCFVYYHRTRQPERDFSLAFMGRKADIQVAVATFRFVQVSAERLSSDYLKATPMKGDRRHLRNSFLLGFVAGLSERLEEQVESQNLSLVLVKDPELDKSFEDLDLKSSPKPKPISIETAAYWEGVEKGSDFDVEGRVLQEVSA